MILTLTTAHLARRFRVAGAAEAARIAQIAAEATNERTASVDGHEGAAIGLVLTGGYRPRDAVLAAIRQADIFATIVPEDTYAVASEVHDLLVKTHPADREKIELIKALVAEHLDIDRILDGRDRGAGRLTRPAGVAGSGLGEHRRAPPDQPAAQPVDLPGDGEQDEPADRAPAARRSPSQIPTDVVVWPIPTSLPLARATSSPGSQPLAADRRLRRRRGDRELIGHDEVAERGADPRGCALSATSRSISPRVSVSCAWTSRTSLIFVALAMIAWRAASVVRRLAIRAVRSTTWPLTSSVLICSVTTVDARPRRASSVASQAALGMR